VNDVAGIALTLSVVTALRVFAPAAWRLTRRLLGATVRIGAESLAERRTAGRASDVAQSASEKGARL
jgi:hypothetical protein